MPPMKFHGNATQKVFWGAHASPRADDRALAIAAFLPNADSYSKEDFGEGAEICTRGACAPRRKI